MSFIIFILFSLLFGHSIQDIRNNHVASKSLSKLNRNGFFKNQPISKHESQNKIIVEGENGEDASTKSLIQTLYRDIENVASNKSDNTIYKSINKHENEDNQEKYLTGNNKDAGNQVQTKEKIPSFLKSNVFIRSNSGTHEELSKELKNDYFGLIPDNPFYDKVDKSILYILKQEIVDIFDEFIKENSKKIQKINENYKVIGDMLKINIKSDNIVITQNMQSTWNQIKNVYKDFEKKRETAINDYELVLEKKNVGLYNFENKNQSELIDIANNLKSATIIVKYLINQAVNSIKSADSEMELITYMFMNFSDELKKKFENIKSNILTIKNEINGISKESKNELNSANTFIGEATKIKEKWSGIDFSYDAQAPSKKVMLLDTFAVIKNFVEQMKKLDGEISTYNKNVNSLVTEINKIKLYGQRSTENTLAAMKGIEGNISLVLKYRGKNVEINSTKKNNADNLKKIKEIAGNFKKSKLLILQYSKELEQCHQKRQQKKSEMFASLKSSHAQLTKLEVNIKNIMKNIDSEKKKMVKMYNDLQFFINFLNPGELLNEKNNIDSALNAITNKDYSPTIKNMVTISNSIKKLHGVENLNIPYDKLSDMIKETEKILNLANEENKLVQETLKNINTFEENVKVFENKILAQLINEFKTKIELKLSEINENKAFISSQETIIDKEKHNLEKLKNEIILRNNKLFENNVSINSIEDISRNFYSEGKQIKQKLDNKLAAILSKCENIMTLKSDIQKSNKDLTDFISHIMKDSYENKFKKPVEEIITQINTLEKENYIANTKSKTTTLNNDMMSLVKHLEAEQIFSAALKLLDAVMKKTEIYKTTATQEKDALMKFLDQQKNIKTIIDEYNSKHKINSSRNFMIAGNIKEMDPIKKKITVSIELMDTLFSDYEKLNTEAKSMKENYKTNKTKVAADALLAQTKVLVKNLNDKRLLLLNEIANYPNTRLQVETFVSSFMNNFSTVSQEKITNWKNECQNILQTASQEFARIKANPYISEYTLIAAKLENNKKQLEQHINDIVKITEDAELEKKKIEKENKTLNDTITHIQSQKKIENVYENITSLKSVITKNEDDVKNIKTNIDNAYEKINNLKKQFEVKIKAAGKIIIDTLIQQLNQKQEFEKTIKNIQDIAEKIDEVKKKHQSDTLPPLSTGHFQVSKILNTIKSKKEEIEKIQQEVSALQIKLKTDNTPDETQQIRKRLESLAQEYYVHLEYMKNEESEIRNVHKFLIQNNVNIILQFINSKLELVKTFKENTEKEEQNAENEKKKSQQHLQSIQQLKNQSQQTSDVAAIQQNIDTVTTLIEGVNKQKMLIAEIVNKSVEHTGKAISHTRDLDMAEERLKYILQHVTDKQESEKANHLETAKSIKEKCHNYLNDAKSALQKIKDHELTVKQHVSDVNKIIEEMFLILYNAKAKNEATQIKNILQQITQAHDSNVTKYSEFVDKITKDVRNYENINDYHHYNSDQVTDALGRIKKLIEELKDMKQKCGRESTLITYILKNAAAEVTHVEENEKIILKANVKHIESVKSTFANIEWSVKNIKMFKQQMDQKEEEGRLLKHTYESKQAAMENYKKSYFLGIIISIANEIQQKKTSIETKNGEIKALFKKIEFFKDNNIPINQSDINQMQLITDETNKIKENGIEINTDVENIIKLCKDGKHSDEIEKLIATVIEKNQNIQQMENEMESKLANLRSILAHIYTEKFDSYVTKTKNEISNASNVQHLIHTNHEEAKKYFDKINDSINEEFINQQIMTINNKIEDMKKEEKNFEHYLNLTKKEMNILKKILEDSDDNSGKKTKTSAVEVLEGNIQKLETSKIENEENHHELANSLKEANAKIERISIKHNIWNSYTKIRSLLLSISEHHEFIEKDYNLIKEMDIGSYALVTNELENVSPMKDLTDTFQKKKKEATILMENLIRNNKNENITSLTHRLDQIKEKVMITKTNVDRKDDEPWKSKLNEIENILNTMYTNTIQVETEMNIILSSLDEVRTQCSQILATEINTLTKNKYMNIVNLHEKVNDMNESIQNMNKKIMNSNHEIETKYKTKISTLAEKLSPYIGESGNYLLEASKIYQMMYGTFVESNELHDKHVLIATVNKLISSYQELQEVKQSIFNNMMIITTFYLEAADVFLECEANITRTNGETLNTAYDDIAKNILKIQESGEILKHAGERISNLSDDDETLYELIKTNQPKLNEMQNQVAVVEQQIHVYLTNIENYSEECSLSEEVISHLDSESDEVQNFYKHDIKQLKSDITFQDIDTLNEHLNKNIRDIHFTCVEILNHSSNNTDIVADLGKYIETEKNIFHNFKDLEEKKEKEHLERKNEQEIKSHVGSIVKIRKYFEDEIFTAKQKADDPNFEFNTEVNFDQILSMPQSDFQLSEEKNDAVKQYTKEIKNDKNKLLGVRNMIKVLSGKCEDERNLMLEIYQLMKRNNNEAAYADATEHVAKSLKIIESFKDEDKVVNDFIETFNVNKASESTGHKETYESSAMRGASSSDSQSSSSGSPKNKKTFRIAGGLLGGIASFGLLGFFIYKYKSSRNDNIEPSSSIESMENDQEDAQFTNNDEDC